MTTTPDPGDGFAVSSRTRTPRLPNSAYDTPADPDAPDYCAECGTAPCEGHDVPRVGDLADHHSGILDPRPVTSVLDGGGSILIKIGEGASGIIGPLPAVNYLFRQPRMPR